MINAIRRLFERKPAGDRPQTTVPSTVTLAHGQSVTTNEPRLVVAGLPPGSYTFTVAATDEDGAVSEVSTCVIEVH